MNIRNKVIVIAATTMGACASEPTEPVAGKPEGDQAIRDYIEVAGLEEVDRIRGTERASWNKVTPTYIIYHARRREYLVEFGKPCYEIWANTRISPDDRALNNVLRAGYDTIRSCRIGRIFALTESEVRELKQFR